MFVRVFDKGKNNYFKSIVYATVGIGWFLKYIVLNPTTKEFVLVDYLDKSIDPAKALVEIIQSNQLGFKIYTGSALLKYKYFCKDKGIEIEDIKQMIGYPDVCENYEFLTDIFEHHSVPIDAYKVDIRNLPDMNEWNYISSQEDADDFMKQFAYFHDSTLEKIQYTEDNAATSAVITFDNSGWFGVVELCFEGIKILKIVPAGEDYSREILEGALIVADESVFWSDCYMENINLKYEGSMIKALNLKWRKI